MKGIVKKNAVMRVLSFIVSITVLFSSITVVFAEEATDLTDVSHMTDAEFFGEWKLGKSDCSCKCDNHRMECIP